MNQIHCLIDKIRLRRMTRMKAVVLETPTFNAFSKELRTNPALLRAFQGSKNALSAFMIHRFPTETLDNTVFDYYLQHHTNVLVNAYNNMIKSKKPMYYHFFWYYVDIFTAYFNKWKEQDLQKLIVPMIQEVHRLETTKTKYLEENSDDAVEIVEHLEKLQHKLKTQMFSLTGKDPDELVANPEYSRIPNMEEAYIESFQRTFWRRFYDSVKEQDYTQVPLFVEDVKKMIKDLIPNRTDIHNTMEARLDTTLLSQMIENNAIDGTIIFNQMEYIIVMIRQLQAAEDDHDTSMFYGLIEDMFRKRFAYEEILTFFFSTVFRKLEKIKAALALI